jgi:alkylated DNA repair protein alkB family protein 4
MAPRRWQQRLLSFEKTSHDDQKLKSNKRQRCETNNNSRFGTCPLCQVTLPLSSLQTHAESCRADNGNETDDTSENTPSGACKKSCADSAGTSRFETCPICNASFPLFLIESHADSCTSGGATDAMKVERKTVPTVSPRPPPKQANDAAAIQQADQDTARPTDSTLPPSNNTSLTIPWWKQAKQQLHIQNLIQPSSQPISGLYLFENFISPQEEAIILAELDGTCSEYRHEYIPWKHGTFNGSSRGKRWGVHCNLREARVDPPLHGMPHFYTSILYPKLVQQIVQMQGCIPNEANAIDYRRKSNHWLSSHVDHRRLSKEPIANLSLAGDCYMTFTHTKTAKQQKVLLKRRTLQVLTGKARYDYAHGIEHNDLLSERRVSVTMRESPLTGNRSNIDMRVCKLVTMRK